MAGRGAMPDGGKFVLCWSCLLVQDALRSRFGSGSRLSSEIERETERERDVSRDLTLVLVRSTVNWFRLYFSRVEAAHTHHEAAQGSAGPKGATGTFLNILTSKSVPGNYKLA